MIYDEYTHNIDKPKNYVKCHQSNANEHNE